MVPATEYRVLERPEHIPGHRPVFIPFFYLLFQFTKRNARFLAAISFWVLGMHIVDTYVTIMPFVRPRGF